MHLSEPLIQALMTAANVIEGADLLGSDPQASQQAHLLREFAADKYVRQVMDERFKKLRHNGKEAEASHSEDLEHFIPLDDVKSGKTTVMRELNNTVATWVGRRVTGNLGHSHLFYNFRHQERADHGVHEVIIGHAVLPQATMPAGA